MQTGHTKRLGSDHPGRDAVVHREIFQLAVLIAIAVVGFFVTRAVAENNRQVTIRDAEALYERGQRLIAAGRVGEAIAPLRRASVRDRDERKYALALAKALERHGETEAARAALLTLRERSPEDVEVNLALGRLAARRQDVTEALRFYHNALYAPWPAASARDRRDVRFDLIDFLLRHDQAGRALSELVAMKSDLPADAATHVRVGQLFARAGDTRQALEQYERALQVEPANKAALARAGMAAFALGDYVKARHYLRLAPDDAGDVARTREIVGFVLSSDPLASRIGSAERRRRLSESLAYVEQRLQRCQAHGGAPAAGSSGTPLDERAADLRKRVNASGVLEQDTIEAGLDLLGLVEQHLANACAPLTARDQALALIAQDSMARPR
jgi:tetratricopeptide (TPR) repeat protein